MFQPSAQPPCAGHRVVGWLLSSLPFNHGTCHVVAAQQVEAAAGTHLEAGTFHPAVQQPCSAVCDAF
jgi:hypothetical protein